MKNQMMLQTKRWLSEYQKYIEDNSIYSPKIVKHYTDKSTYFPIITCVISNNTSTDEHSTQNIEEYEMFYITINIYAKDQTRGANIKVAAQVIVDEIVDLTDYFFNKIMNLRKTLNEPIPNIDKRILRQVMNFQGLVGNIRGNIIRR